jgi:hypothetical protein
MISRTVARNDLDGPRAEIQTIHELRIRAPQATTSPELANTSPFFPEPSTLRPAGSSNESGGLAKSVLEYLFLALALIIVTSIILRRLTRLKRMNQPISTFFHSDNDYPNTSHIRTPRNFPRTTGLPPLSRDGLPYPPYPDPHLTGFPAVYLGRNTRRTNAQDIDASGRRVVAQSVELDHGGELGDKDALPAYDHYGGPPKYVELEMQARLFGNGSRIQPPVEEPANQVSDNLGIPPGLTSVTSSLSQVNGVGNEQVLPGYPLANMDLTSPLTNATTYATDARRDST